MIDRKELMHRKADDLFANKFVNGHIHIPRNLQTLKEKYDDIFCELNFDSDKLSFLHRLHRSVRNWFDGHRENCAHWQEGRECPAERNAEDFLFLIEQEIFKLNENFDFRILLPNIDGKLIQDISQRIETYPKAAKPYVCAIDKLHENKYERNTLDDLRRCVEELLRAILSTNKSLENLKNEIGLYLKKKKVNTNIRTWFIQTFAFFIYYQNDTVKHGDVTDRIDYSFVWNLTNTMILFLLELEDQ